MATMIMRMATVFCAALLGSMACASTPTTVMATVGHERVVVVGDAPWVVAALPAARDRLRAFGLDIRVPTTITVHANVDSFVKATEQTDGNLRAWTTFQSIHLLDRWTWHNADDAHTLARITHELCHAALYQALGDDAAAARLVRPPRSVEEGLCSVVADQGHDRMPMAALQQWCVEHQTVDVWDGAAFHEHPDAAYGAAHEWFAAVYSVDHQPLTAALVAALRKRQLPPSFELQRQHVDAVVRQSSPTTTRHQPSDGHAR